MQVDVKIHSVNVDATEDLHSFINKRIEKLTVFYDRIVDGEVYLKVENNHKVENKLAEVKIRIPGHELFAKKQCKSFEEAVDMAVEAIRRQLRKQKTKEKALV